MNILTNPTPPPGYSIKAADWEAPQFISIHRTSAIHPRLGVGRVACVWRLVMPSLGDLLNGEIGNININCTFFAPTKTAEVLIREKTRPSLLQVRNPEGTVRNHIFQKTMSSSANFLWHFYHVDSDPGGNWLRIHMYPDRKHCYL
jgi:hypothetical protein